MGETLINESLIGTVLRARVLRETGLGMFSAVVPEVSRTAHVYGRATCMLDRNVPLRYSSMSCMAGNPTILRGVGKGDDVTTIGASRCAATLSSQIHQKRLSLWTIQLQNGIKFGWHELQMPALKCKRLAKLR